MLPVVSDDEASEGNLDDEVPNRERLVADAVALTGGDTDLAELLRLYWRLVPDEDLVGREPADLVAITVHHRELAAQRLPGEVKLAVSATEPGPPEALYDGARTVIDLVTDDMPFLVDSLTALFTRKGVEVHLLVHPQVQVKRQVMGAMESVPADSDPSGVAESWMHIEIERQRETADIEALHNDILRVLTDVREVVEDWQKMRDQALGLADELSRGEGSLPVPGKDITDAVDLLRWLTDDHFTFLGYREYRLQEREDGTSLCAVLGTGLGILRQDQVTPKALSSMAPEAYEKVLEKRLLIITKANSRSTVHRNAYLDYIGFKVFDDEGNVIGERRFLGLFTSAAYLHSVRELPVVRRKVAEVLQRSGLAATGHSGKDLLATMETYPRDDLFQISTDELYRTVMGVLRLAGRRRLRLFLRRDAYGRFISCLVYLPRDRFNTDNRLRIEKILEERLNSEGVDYTTRVGDSPLARIHYIIHTDPKRPLGEVNVEAIQDELTEATRSWDADFGLLLDRKLGEEQAHDLYQRYVEAYSQTYKDEHTPFEAAKDIAKLELLDEPGELALHLFRHRKRDDDVRFKVFRYGEPMMLSAVLPVLHSLGVQVADERPYEINREDDVIYVYNFGLKLPADVEIQVPQVRAKVENAFSAAWRGESEVDGFNELVLRANMTWREVVILRAYAKYLRQAGSIHSQRFMWETFRNHPKIAASLVELFQTRFDPELQLTAQAREEAAGAIVEHIRGELDQVASLDADRIMRAFLLLIESTLRTSFFQRGNGRPKPYVSFKLDPQKLAELLPAPRPKYEIFVYSPRFEGVHLRFGAVARGGLRWSDRREDFRTEVLGLVKAQMVKNSVIVPVGAKGGFVLKNPPADRDALFNEGVACYKAFISALLDITDNLDPSGKVVPPVEVVRHDGDDPYLVVAADKGTATFSDIANEIAVSYGFWLGDAFASGGSAGYDHKKMGITARGAWESVKHHFRELGTDTQSEDFTVVGIGDMGGDVFGNGMLLSEHIRLVAAFNHMHVFIDPEPDAAASFPERRRLFDLPRSTWDDYDKSLISEGGGVWSRSLKSIPITPQVREALGLDETVTRLAPNDLINAILKAPVDLLWNGGIGTYVKAASESNAEVGDKTNDTLRVNGGELRAKVVGEGGNLGLTQLGRIEFALACGNIATDFIDNSAGVDCSDHEVNIKVLLSRAITSGELDQADRDALLAEMTDEVAELVLRDNYDQSTALGVAGAQALTLLPVHRRLLAYLEKHAGLDRKLEGLPTDKELTQRTSSGRGLTRPEFAVMLSYVKLDLENEILDGTLPDDAWTKAVLTEYFPHPLRERFARIMPEHPLRREIVTTALVNEVVNHGGTSFVFRIMEETGASADDAIRAYAIIRKVFGLSELWTAIEELDNVVPTEAQVAGLLVVRRLVDRGVRWLVQNRRVPLDVEAEVSRLSEGVSALLPRMPELLLGSERESMHGYASKLAATGLPGELAERLACLIYGFGLIDVVEVANASGHDLNEVAEVYFTIGERFTADTVLNKISDLPREDRWQTLARMALRYDLYAAVAALTAEVLTSTGSEEPAVERVAEWEKQNAPTLVRVQNAMGEFVHSRADLAALSVLLRQIRTLVQASASSG
ncbi:NAD-glutamate dehydrogenase [Phytomonospora endophytica]|nr:NAD-glutamate dehydrogenase [Phytomonospora endophytica]